MANNAQSLEGEQLMLALWNTEHVTASAADTAPMPASIEDHDKAFGDKDEGASRSEVPPTIIEKGTESVSSDVTDLTLTCEALSSAVALIVAETMPDAEAVYPETAVEEAESRAEGKKVKSEYPKFFPAVRFGPTVDKYDGTLYLSPVHIFHVTANRQQNSESFYAVRGMITMQDLDIGGSMQESGDRRREILERRAKKGMAHVKGKRSQATAVKRELLIKPHPKSPDYTKDIKAEAISRAQNLLNEHKEQVTEQILHGVPAEKLTLSIIFSGYGSAYLDDRTRSKNSRRNYTGLIRRVIDAIGDVELGNWSKSFLTRNEKKHEAINAENMKEVSRFLNYFANKRHITNPVAECLREYLAERGSNKKDPKESQKDATAGVRLSSEVEQFLDQGCWENLGDPRYAFIELAKEGGLTAEAACSLLVKDICRDSENVQKVSVEFRRDELQSATHDYTFPLFPWGAVYVNEYLSKLARVYGDDRIKGDRYLLSEDPGGEKKHDAKNLKNFINTLLSHHKIGYAELVSLEGMVKKSRGSFLLHKTYEDRLNEIFCDPGRKKKDDGAVTFMLHKSLVGSVQMDHYRALTDFTGKKYLFGSLCCDKRNPMKYLDREKPPHSKRSIRKGDDINSRVFRYPAKADNCGRVMEMDVKGLKVGDEVTFEAERGLLVSVITS